MSVPAQKDVGAFSYQFRTAFACLLLKFRLNIMPAREDNVTIYYFLFISFNLFAFFFIHFLINKFYLLRLNLLQAVTSVPTYNSVVFPITRASEKFSDD